MYPVPRVPLLTVFLLVGRLFAAAPAPEAAGWKVGFASLKITPTEPLMLAGYSGRTQPAREVDDDVYRTAGIEAAVRDGMDVINHECGHSIGRPHANYWDTGGKSAIGPGANQEYGNSFDVMGGGGGFSRGVLRQCRRSGKANSHEAARRQHPEFFHDILPGP